MTSLKPGDLVVITDGLSRDARGVIRDRAKLDWRLPTGAVPMFCVELPVGLRTIRADWLRLAEVLS